MQQFGLLAVLTCLLVSWVGHVPALIRLMGEGAASFLNRQSESYLMIALVIGFWMWIAPHGHPAAHSPAEDRIPRTSPIHWLAWFAVLLTSLVAMVTWESAPNTFVTQKETMSAVVVISAYLGWSRGLRPSDVQWRRGQPVKGSLARFGFYVGVIFVMALATTDIPAAVFGGRMAAWLAGSNEGFLAIVLISVYFDIFARSESRWPTAVWYSALFAVPIVLQLELLPAVFDAQAGWLGQVTEAFIAAIGVSFFFDTLRPADVAATERNAEPEAVEALGRALIGDNR